MDDTVGLEDQESTILVGERPSQLLRVVRTIVHVYGHTSRPSPLFCSLTRVRARSPNMHKYVLLGMDKKWSGNYPSYCTGGYGPVFYK